MPGGVGQLEKLGAFHTQYGGDQVAGDRQNLDLENIELSTIQQSSTK